MNDIDKIAKDIGLEFNNVKFTKDQFKRGIDVEMTEHHDDPQTQVINSRLEAAKIAWAHLKEDPKYYTKLKKMEESTVLEELEELLNSLDEGVAKKYQSSAGGLNDRGRAYYNRQGHDLKKPVSSKQAAKSKKSGWA